MFYRSGGPSWLWSYGSTSWIYHAYHHWCCEFESWSGRGHSTTLCDKVCQWLATGRWFSPGPPVSSTNKTDRHDITEILLKVALNTIQTNKQTNILPLRELSVYPSICHDIRCILFPSINIYVCSTLFSFLRCLYCIYIYIDIYCRYACG